MKDLLKLLDARRQTQMGHGWIAVDLDGTLAEYDSWQGIAHIGAPIPLMVDRVKKWLVEGHDVRIFTARVATTDVMELAEFVSALDAWTLQHVGTTLPVTNVKDFAMIELWDDRAIQVVPNTGLALGDELLALQGAP